MPRLVELNVIAPCSDSKCKRRSAACVVCIARRILKTLNDLEQDIGDGSLTSDIENPIVDAMVTDDDWRVSRQFYDYDKAEKGEQ